MSVQSEIERISNNIEETYDVLEESGAEVPEVRNSDNLPETVRVATTPVNPDWSQSDSTQKDYIKNRTHYEEVVTYEWDGNEEGYEVITCVSNPNMKYVKISDEVPNKNDFSVFGVCKCCSYYINNTENNSYREISSEGYYIGVNVNKGKKIVTANLNASKYLGFSGWSHTVCFYDSTVSVGGYNLSRSCRVVVMYEDGKHLDTSLKAGVYFTKGIVDPDRTPLREERTIKYSYIKYHHISDFYLKRSIEDYSECYNDPNNVSLGKYGHVEGYNNYGGLYFKNTSGITHNFENYGSAKAFHVEGSNNVLDNESGHVEGAYNVVMSSASAGHIEGYSNSVNDSGNNYYGTNHGFHVEGDSNDVLVGGAGGHIEGAFNTNIYLNTGDHIEGTYNILGPSGDSRHVQNAYNEVTAEGASGSGYHNKASGRYSDVGGKYSESLHDYSFVRGSYNKSGSENQAVFGTYNEVFDDSLFDVGNGTSESNRKTAFSVKRDGSACVQTQGEAEDSITRKDYVDNLVKNSVDEAVVNILNIAERVDSWETVQKIVRAGYAPFIFKVGDQFVCNHSEFGELTWDVIGFNHDKPTDSNYKYSMTLQLHDILDTTYREFDGREAIFCASEEINPGNYCISYNNKIDGSGATSYVKFTIPEGVVVPVGGLFVNLATSGNIYTILQDCFSTDTPLGTFTITGTTSVPAGYTLLGEGNYYKAYGVTSASNYYKESGIRFYLNGNSSDSIDWVPQHSCDMPPSYVNSSGFMCGLDEDFKNVLGKVSKKTYDLVSNSIVCTDDFIFLPSRSEVYGGNNISTLGSEVDEELPYEYYINNSELEEGDASKDSNRIKYGSDDEAYAYFLRSTYLSSSTAANNSTVLFRIGRVSTNGSISIGTCRSNSSNNNAYLVPCCCIV